MKRLFDVIMSFIGLIFLSPILLITYILIVTKLGKPALFSQNRPGLNGDVFKMYKFRSMTDERDGKGNLLSDEDRLTSFGKKLRSTSLDELPALINVLKGDLSLVGPRPLLVEYLPLYNIEQKRRHDVKPGITGWAQVNGRNAIGWEEKFKLDVWYVDNRTFILDIKIILLTIKKVIVKEGISEEGQSTASAFKGTTKERNHSEY